jgi:hypothetical protein
MLACRLALAAIDVPVTVLFGADDETRSPDLGATPTSRIPTAERIVVPGLGGSSLLWARPELVLDAACARRGNTRGTARSTLGRRRPSGTFAIISKSPSTGTRPTVRAARAVGRSGRRGALQIGEVDPLQAARSPARTPTGSESGAGRSSEA